MLASTVSVSVLTTDVALSLRQYFLESEGKLKERPRNKSICFCSVVGIRIGMDHMYSSRKQVILGSYHKNNVTIQAACSAVSLIMFSEDFTFFSL